MAITVGTGHRDKILLRQNHSLRGAGNRHLLCDCVIKLNTIYRLHVNAYYEIYTVKWTMYFRFPAGGILMTTGEKFRLHCALERIHELTQLEKSYIIIYYHTFNHTPEFYLPSSVTTCIVHIPRSDLHVHCP